MPRQEAKDEDKHVHVIVPGEISIHWSVGTNKLIDYYPFLERCKNKLHTVLLILWPVHPERSHDLMRPIAVDDSGFKHGCSTAYFITQSMQEAMMMFHISSLYDEQFNHR